jgi:uncharacterized protein involved in exopolysaccharide biosynthesis
MSIRWIRTPSIRRTVIVIAALVLAILTLWPRHYLARAELIPDQNSGGLPSILSGGGNALASLGALVGARQSIESDLSIARSQGVARDAAIGMLKRGLLNGSDTNSSDIDRATSTVQREVEIEAITGSILQISARADSPMAAKGLVEEYERAVRGRLTVISVNQSKQKKAIASERMAEASLDLARAQSAIDQFRAANRLSEPKIELGAAISLVTSLQAKLQADQSALATLAKFATPENIQVQALHAEIDSLRRQIATAQTSANSGPGPSVGGMTPKITEYENLYRDQNYAEAEYEIYKRYLDTVTAEFLSSDINMTLIEAPYLVTERQLNAHPLIALMLLLAMGVLAEFYIAKPPPGWTRHEVR